MCLHRRELDESIGDYMLDEPDPHAYDEEPYDDIREDPQPPTDEYFICSQLFSFGDGEYERCDRPSNHAGPHGHAGKLLDALWLIGTGKSQREWSKK